MCYTKGNWEIGAYGGNVVTNIPNDNRPYYTWEDKESEYNHYGGYLIAESIATIDDAKLICAAPCLLNVLECIVEANEDIPQIPYSIYLSAKKAVLKARAAMFPTPFYVMPELNRPFPLLLSCVNPNQHHSYFSKEK